MFFAGMIVGFAFRHLIGVFYKMEKETPHDTETDGRIDDSGLKE